MNPTRCGLLVERTRNWAAGSEDAAARETKGWEILRTGSHARPRANCGTKDLVRCVRYPSISSLTRLWAHANRTKRALAQRGCQKLCQGYV